MSSREQFEFAVVSPEGRRERSDSTVIDRPSGLDGLCVGYVWDYVFRGDEMFELVTAEVRARFDDVEFVDYEVFGNVHGNAAEEAEAFSRLEERLRAHEVDVVVAGVGA